MICRKEAISSSTVGGDRNPRVVEAMRTNLKEETVAAVGDGRLGADEFVAVKGSMPPSVVASWSGSTNSK